ncbi:aminoglycoside phosphotransferase family protein [Streptomyces sp. NPDC046870]|uniref:aminoglycoside phosphotransferase family protein n=1 Tax=Streptomyces sp. NPDC046870 TaxID=3155135 RepID=UPI003451BC60
MTARLAPAPPTRAVPQARSARLPWTALPPAARAEVERLLGSSVTWSRTQSGGFSRGVATRLRCADGTRAFVKAVPRHGDPYAVALYEREAAVAAQLPAALPAPAFRGTVDTGDWLALVFDAAAGRTPPVPWRERDLRLVLGALVRLTELAASCPVPAAKPWGGTLADWRGWNHLLGDREGLGGVEGLDGLAPWARRHVDRLARLEESFPQAARGDTLLHSDLRSDNILVAGSTVRFVDWAWAARGQDWIDPMIFALCAAVQGLADPQGLFLAHPAGRAADPRAVDSVLAALAGSFVNASRQPADWDTGAIREFQRAEAAATCRWLAARTGWE